MRDFLFILASMKKLIGLFFTMLLVLFVNAEPAKSSVNQKSEIHYDAVISVAADSVNILVVAEKDSAAQFYRQGFEAINNPDIGLLKKVSSVLVKHPNPLILEKWKWIDTNTLCFNKTKISDTVNLTNYRRARDGLMCSFKV